MAHLVVKSVGRRPPPSHQTIVWLSEAEVKTKHETQSLIFSSASNRSQILQASLRVCNATREILVFKLVSNARRLPRSTFQVTAEPIAKGTIPPNLSRTITVRVKSRKPLQSSFGKTKLLIQWYGSSSNSEATDKELNIDWNPTKVRSLVLECCTNGMLLPRPENLKTVAAQESAPGTEIQPFDLKSRPTLILDDQGYPNFWLQLIFSTLFTLIVLEMLQK